MAKSLRSKWLRKMKAIKRERYGEKETQRLVKMLKAAGELEDEENSGVQELSTTIIGQVKVEKVEEDGEEMEVIEPKKERSISAQNRKSRRDELKREGRRGRSKSKGEGEEEEEMAVDKPEHVFSKRTMRDQFGNYPAWMNKRKMRTQQNKNKRIAKRRAMSVSGGKRKRMA